MNIWWVIFWWVIGLGVAVTLFVVWFKTYKHTFVIRYLTSTKDIAIIDKFKFGKKESGSEFVKFRHFFKYKAPVPPDEAIDIGPKGTYFVEAWRDENGIFTYISTGTGVKKLLWNTEKIINAACDIDGCKETEVNKDFVGRLICKNHWDKHSARLGSRDPITTDDKDFYAAEVDDSHKYDSHNWKRDLPVYFSVGMFAMIIVCGMIFGPELINAHKESLGMHAGITKQQAQITADLKEIILERQTIGGTPEQPVKPPN